MKALCTAISCQRSLSTIFSNPALNQSPVAEMPITREQVNGPAGLVGTGALGLPSGGGPASASAVGATSVGGVTGEGGEGAASFGGVGATEGSSPMAGAGSTGLLSGAGRAGWDGLEPHASVVRLRPTPRLQRRRC